MNKPENRGGGFGRFNGLCMAFVQSATQAGPIHLTAAEGLASAAAVIQGLSKP